jgi:hypothetical protein
MYNSTKMKSWSLQSVLTFGVVMVMSICLLSFLLAGCQHIIEGVVTDALPVAETRKHTFRVVEHYQPCPHLTNKSQK